MTSSSMSADYSAKDLGRVLGKMSEEQARIQENLYPDDPDAQLLLQFNESIVLNPSLTATRYTYPSNSFIVDHPVYGNVNSATLLIDGGYAAADAALVVSSTPGSFGVPFVLGSPIYWVAQSFSLSSSSSIAGASVFLSAVGSPSGNIVFRLETTVGIAPSGVLVHANATGTLNAALLSGSASYAVNFAGSFDLASGTLYHLVIYMVYNNASNYVGIGVDLTYPYAGGQRWTNWSTPQSYVDTPSQDLCCTILRAVGPVIIFRDTT